eukprot:g2585.t1
MKSFRPRPSQAQGTGKSDLLLRLFDSQFFDAWLALTYLYQKETSGVHDYLCNKLYELPEDKIERYLSQFCQLITTRHGSSLERVIVDWCSKSLRIAVYWLFRAISQDQPKNKQVAELLDRCERSALNGSWELPFKSPLLDPPSSVLQSKTDSAFLQNSPVLVDPAESEEDRSESPVGDESASICSSTSIVQGLEGLFTVVTLGRTCSGSRAGDLPTTTDQTGSQDVLSVDTDVSSSATFERCRVLRQELGEGEGVSALLARSSRNEAAGGNGCLATSENEELGLLSPGLRQTTVGATLDFVDALCDASSHLVQLPQESRLKALKRALADINSEIDLCNANGVTVWFPIGNRNQRVLRLVPDQTVLLNSREKAPFLLLVEVLDTEGAEDSEEDTQPYADSANSVEKADNSRTEEPKGSVVQQDSDPQMLEEGPSQEESMNPKMLTEEEQQSLTDAGLVQKPNCKNSFDTKMDTALASLQGSAPLVKLHFKIDESIVETQISSSSSSSVTPSVVSQTPAEGAMSLMMSKILKCSGNCMDIGIPEDWFRRQQHVHERNPISVSFEVVGGVNLKIPSPSKKSRRMPSQEAIDVVAAKLVKNNSMQQKGPLPTASSSQIPPLPPPSSSFQSVPEPSRSSRDLTPHEKALRRWNEKRDCVRQRSPHGERPGWKLASVVVKSGDDCRQELMAVQLIKTFQEIFLDSRIPLWVYPYEVLVTSNRTALIEFIPDTLSVHSIKHKSPPGTSLSQHFFDKFVKGTPECNGAQRNFVESLAAYSLISYLLQLKDRHNGNILMDDEGHIIHIDFGFMLSNSPGGVNFEAAPFKLTREYLEIMESNSEGKASELFDYFKVLCIQGFLICRKHFDRIVLVCDIMSKAGFPCFKAGDRAIKALKRRFHLNIPDEQCVQIVIGAISDSLDAWRTRQYDYYQRVLNGIL